MNHPAASIVLVAILAVISQSIGRAAVEVSDPQQKQEPAKKKKTEQVTSLTGCIDQQAGKYVLIDAQSAAPIADLVAVGFPTEGFAKHVGQKVTVRGTSNPGDARPVMQVRSIETISACAPQR